MSDTLTLSAAARQLHSKPYSEAEGVAEKLVEKKLMTEEEALEALESHPGNPANGDADDMPTDKIGLLTYLAAHPDKITEVSAALSKLDRPTGGNLYCKVSAKGAISVYGINRMPVTLYIEQWERLLEYGPQIVDFIVGNEGKTFDIAEKDDKGKATGKTLKVKLQRGKQAK